jgi:DNA-directed RNA polymerase specialized sigma24 family protein
LFEWAVDRIRCDFEDTTWQAFWQTSVDDRESRDVAEELGMSVGAVYIARSRVLARLRKEIEEVDD